MLAMSGTMVLPGLIFQVFHGCQTHVQAKDASNGSKVNFSFFSTFMGNFFPPTWNPNIIFFNFDFFICLHWVGICNTFF